MTRIKLPATILACLADATLVAASVPAKSAAPTDTRASSLQRDLDALVTAGAPGGRCSPGDCSSPRSCER